jgi:hypothetical protein
MLMLALHHGPIWMTWPERITGRRRRIFPQQKSFLGRDKAGGRE